MCTLFAPKRWKLGIEYNFFSADADVASLNSSQMAPFKGAVPAQISLIMMLILHQIK